MFITKTFSRGGILWNVVTSLGENKNPPPYFIVLASSVKTKEVEVIEFHRIVLLWLQHARDKRQV